MHRILPHVEIPSPLREAIAAAKGTEYLNGWAYETLALQAYRDGFISRGKLRSILGMNFDEGDAYLKSIGVPYRMTLEDVMEDFQTAKRLHS